MASATFLFAKKEPSNPEVTLEGTGSHQRVNTGDLDLGVFLWILVAYHMTPTIMWPQI